VSTASSIEDWSLADHLKLILRASWLIVLLALLGGASAFYFSKRSISTASALVRIGTLHGIGYVEAPVDLASRVSGPSFLDALIHAHLGELAADASSVSLSASQSAGLLTLVVTAPTEGTAKQVADLAAQRIIAEHEPAARLFSNMSKTRLEEMDRSIRELRAVLDADQRKDITPFHRSTLARDDSDQPTTMESLIQLQHDRYDLALHSSAIFSRGSELLEAPSVSTAAIGKKQAISGLLAGAALAIAFAYAFALIRRSDSEQVVDLAAKRGAVQPQPQAEVRTIAKV
jgi:hypothetical protein